MAIARSRSQSPERGGDGREVSAADLADRELARLTADEKLHQFDIKSDEILEMRLRLRMLRDKLRSFKKYKFAVSDIALELLMCTGTQEGNGVLNEQAVQQLRAAIRAEKTTITEDMARNPGGDKVSGFFDKAAEAAKQIRSITDYKGEGGAGGSNDSKNGGGGGGGAPSRRHGQSVGAINLDEELRSFFKGNNFGAAQLKKAAEELEIRSAAQEDAEERERRSKEARDAKAAKEMIGKSGEAGAAGEGADGADGADGEGADGGECSSKQGVSFNPRTSGRLMSQGAITKIRSISPLMRKSQRMKAFENKNR